MRSNMMRCVVMVMAVLAAGQAEATENLALDATLLDDVVKTVLEHGLPSPSMAPMVEETPPAKSKGGGSGGGGGAKQLPPQLSGVGLGFQVGSPTALTIKFGGVQQDGFVVGIGAGFSVYGRNVGAPSLSLHADYLVHLATLVHNEQLALTGYVGIGGWLLLGGTNYSYGFFGQRPYLNNLFFGLGVRVPLGLALSFASAPIEIYLELDPALFVFPGFDFGIGASLGFRWHF